MQYRQFGSLDWYASALGFGCMRLPTLGDRSAIDEPEAARMLAYAIDHGVNYLDTAYGYHGGNSERFLGRFLSSGYRDRVRVATKLPCPLVEKEEDFERLLGEQMARLQSEHIDFYLLHGLRQDRWENMLRLDVPAKMEKAVADGRVGHLGFSFHGNTTLLKQVIDTFGGWSMCQIQYNYMNEQVQAGTEGLQYAHSKGLAVVIMEPLLGGKLVNPPAGVQAIWDEDAQDRLPAEWALQWLWSKPEVSVALSGMSTMEQVQQNVASAGRSAIGLLSSEELEVIARVRDRYQDLCPVPCTDCKYCLPCPNGVDIPGNLGALNTGVMYDAMGDARLRYERRPEGQRASACIQCRECEDKCPQSILISEWMPFVHQGLGENASFDQQICARLNAQSK